MQYEGSDFRGLHRFHRMLSVDSFHASFHSLSKSIWCITSGFIAIIRNLRHWSVKIKKINPDGLIESFNGRILRMLAPVRMIVTYPLYMAMERAIFHSQTFEKTWSGLRPKLEKGVELIAQEVHPQGRNFIRRMSIKNLRPAEFVPNASKRCSIMKSCLFSA